MEAFVPPLAKEKRPRGRQSKVSVEYQIMIARKCLEEGMTFREAAKTFNVSHGSVYAFIQKYKNKGANAKRNARASKYNKEAEAYRHQSRINDLKLEIGELYLENLLLKKALQHSLKMKKEDSSIITSENLERLKEGVK